MKHAFFSLTRSFLVEKLVMPAFQQGKLFVSTAVTENLTKTNDEVIAQHGTARSSSGSNYLKFSFILKLAFEMLYFEQFQLFF